MKIITITNLQEELNPTIIPKDILENQQGIIIQSKDSIVELLNDIGKTIESVYSWEDESIIKLLVIKLLMSFDNILKYCKQEKDSSLEKRAIDIKNKVLHQLLCKNIENLIEREVVNKLLDYSNENKSKKIINSAAYITFRENLSDFIGNSYDANATEITFILPEDDDLVSNENKVRIILTDNGKGFPESMLQTKEEEFKIPSGKKVIDLLGNNIKLDSHKVKCSTQHGGAGMGLARSAIFLKEKNGNIYLRRNDLGKGAIIVFESDPGIADLELQFSSFARKFGAIKRSQVTEEKFEVSEQKEDEQKQVENQPPNVKSVAYGHLDSVSSATIVSSTFNSKESKFQNETMLPLDVISSFMAVSSISDHMNNPPSSLIHSTEQSMTVNETWIIVESADDPLEEETRILVQPRDPLEKQIFDSLREVENFYKKIGKDTKARRVNKTISFIHDLKDNISPEEKNNQILTFITDLKTYLLERKGVKLSLFGDVNSEHNLENNMKCIDLLIEHLQQEVSRCEQPVAMSSCF